MESKSLKFNLKLLNVFIAMCKGDQGLPNDLRRLGFHEHAVELRFQNSSREVVVPELIIASRQVRQTLLFEWKNGANTEADQLRRYSRITTQDLIQHAMLGADQCAAHDVTVVGLEEHGDRIVMGIDAGHYTFPVLIATADGLQLFRNQFAVAETQAVFAAGLRFNWDTIPTAYFPVDPDSELWEYAEQVLRRVVINLSEGVTRILADDIGRAIIPCWQTSTREFKTGVKAKITQVLEYAANHDFSRYLERNRAAEGRTGSSTWDVRDNPLLNQLDKRLKIWRTMARQQANVISHFQDPQRQEDLPLAQAAPE